MTNQNEQACLMLEVNNFLALYWDEMEKGDGNGMPAFLTEDSLYDAKILRLEGRDKICAYSNQRAGTIKSKARHLMSNQFYDFSRLDSGEVTVRAIMTHFGGIGEAILPTSIPMGIYDMVFILKRGGIHGWELSATLYEPVFLQEDAIKRYTGQS